MRAGLTRTMRDGLYLVQPRRIKHLWTLPVVGLIGIAYVTSAHAASSAGPTSSLTLRRFELLDQLAGSAESSELNAYLAAVGDSLELANNFLASGGRERLFCSESALNAATLRKILRERIVFLSNLGQDTDTMKVRSRVVTVILQILRERYPCR